MSYLYISALFQSVIATPLAVVAAGLDDDSSSESSESSSEEDDGVAAILKLPDPDGTFTLLGHSGSVDSSSGSAEAGYVNLNGLSEDVEGYGLDGIEGLEMDGEGEGFGLAGIGMA